MPADVSDTAKDLQVGGAAPAQIVVADLALLDDEVLELLHNVQARVEDGGGPVWAEPRMGNATRG
eukprot:5711605-Prorocentrum_lima.AAC.1